MTLRGEETDAGRLPLSEALVAELSRLAGVDPGADVRWRDLGGSRTTNILAHTADGERGTVFRVHQPSTTSARVRAEQEARQVLARSHIPAVEPSLDFDGDGLAQLTSGRVVEAEPFVAPDGPMDTSERLLAGFGVLGALHRCLGSARLPGEASTVRHANHVPARGSLRLAGPGVRRVRAWDDPALTAYADAVLDHVAAVSEKEAPLAVGLPRQVVHGDFWDNNVLFAGGIVAAVLDFGFMAERARIDDLALPIWFHLLGTGRPGPTEDDLALVVRLVEAYERHGGPLTDEERLALPLAVARQPAWSIGRWVSELPEQEARSHARAAAAELPVASAVLSGLGVWQAALARRSSR